MMKTSEEDLQKIIGSDVIIGRAYDVLNQYNWSKEERFAYDQTKKHIDDYLSSIQQGKIEGKIEGIKIGEEKGRKEGREEGKIEVAKTMLANNIDVNTIVKCTGLSISEIEELQN
ncbi:transposase [Nephila pilipes]|uniref:Transposase n=1 Tax=Nephila pilipes TaxID=299642 RepID=A0A8X6PQD6_NEPPI|nr:transposase [Nephila pilipes]